MNTTVTKYKPYIHIKYRDNSTNKQTVNGLFHCK